ncbi:hypothetical protein ABT187_41920 [Streptomyces sp. NPDC001817]|uniref:hypothetical protein n=1 Tax=Streptomyces sp. NPDC001817 TaxID=3154398 RepID=UPI0033324783
MQPARPPARPGQGQIGGTSLWSLKKPESLTPRPSPPTRDVPPGDVSSLLNAGVQGGHQVEDLGRLLLLGRLRQQPLLALGLDDLRDGLGVAV